MPHHGLVAREGDGTLLARVRSEFLEMPGLRLAPRQAARLWAVDPALSARVLDALVRSGFLRKTADGAYLRLDMA
jgi:hypothetical protein